jgi:hypothetical protein
MKNKIQQTAKFQEMVKKTPFLKTTYLSPENVRYITELVGQCERLGRDYLNDKKINKRDLDIVDEIVQINLNEKSTLKN